MLTMNMLMGQKITPCLPTENQIDRLAGLMKIASDGEIVEEAKAEHPKESEKIFLYF